MLHPFKINNILRHFAISKLIIIFLINHNFRSINFPKYYFSTSNQNTIIPSISFSNISFETYIILSKNWTWLSPPVTLWSNTFFLWNPSLETMPWITALCIKPSACMDWLSVKLHMSHYGLSIVLSFVTMLPRNIWIPRLFWVNILFDIITLTLMILVNLPSYLLIVLKIIQLVRIKICSTINHPPSSY